MAEVLLQARDVKKAYVRHGQRLEVLSGIDIAIERGQTVSVMGASGAGKSTLLHILGSLDEADSGDLHFCGEPLLGRPSSALAHFRNQSLGFVFQFHHLLPDFDALENVMMPALIARHARSRARALATEALALVGLSQRHFHRPQELSGGEQQRVALARAIVLRPALLMLDEVTGNLDATTAQSIHRLLEELNKTTGAALVVVTHHRPLAERMHVQLALQQGRLCPLLPASPSVEAAP